MEILLLDCRELRDREPAHEYLFRTLRLPSWYGRNLDALADCLGELGTRVTVILYNTALLGQEDYGQKIVEVFRQCTSPNGFSLIEKE